MSVRAWLGLALLALTSALGGYVWYRWLPSGFTALTEADVRRPDFSLPDLKGRPRTASEWNGKVLVLNFWATWCPPCRREIPTFVEMQKQYSDKGLQFVGVAIDNPKDVSAFATQAAINYPLLVAEQEGIVLAHKLGNSLEVLPFTAVVDRQGKVVFTKLGEVTRVQAEKTILPLLSR